MDQELIPKYRRDESLDYLNVLRALKEIPFSVGKNLLIDFLIGKETSQMTKNCMHFLEYFGSLKKEKIEIEDIIDNLISLNLIQTTNKNFLKLLEITEKGNQEILSPKLNSKKNKTRLIEKKTIISEEDKIKFNELKTFLIHYNDEQKKAVISDKKKILCIAGAGSGKTTVLTKRIEFLTKYKGIDPEKILAITFTRKARQEMLKRLIKLGVEARVETFNSFCEKILLRHGNKIYLKNVRLMSYHDKIMAIVSALNSLRTNMSFAIDKYFSQSQKKSKTSDQLSNLLMNDCFFILEYFKTKNQELYDFSKEADKEDMEVAKMIYNICKYLKDYMNLQGFRDYADQVLDVIKFFKNNNEYIPKFEHVLVDEYQDVNEMQMELLDLLNPPNLFCVGDPRQSIFGWRGSNINYLLDFEKKYPGSEIISLTKNYRSNNHIVNFMNASIKEMNLPDLEPNFNGEKEIFLYNFESENQEMNFVIKEIIGSKIEKERIFVLARTNNQLNELSRMMKLMGIDHIIKSDEVLHPVQLKKGQVTLATIHSIKGLEARMVFLIGCNEANFPCKASDHPVIEIIKPEEYDKEEEEKRLFYVAISRAKNKLYLTYTGKKPTYFINSKMKEILGENIKSTNKTLDPL